MSGYVKGLELSIINSILGYPTNTPSNTMVFCNIYDERLNIYNQYNTRINIPSNIIMFIKKYFNITIDKRNGMIIINHDLAIRSLGFMFDNTIIFLELGKQIGIVLLTPGSKKSIVTTMEDMVLYTYHNRSLKYDEADSILNYDPLHELITVYARSYIHSRLIDWKLEFPETEIMKLSIILTR